MSVLLPTGYRMPRLALGTFAMQKDLIPETIQTAILDVGYRHIDTAANYGVEREVGQGITAALYTGCVSREDLFITTKCWMSWYRNVREACLRSLARLNLTYIDLYLLHFPFALKPDPQDPDMFKPGPGQVFDNVPLHVAWAQMEALVAEGLVRHIGVCNWTVALMRDMLSYAQIRPVCNQFEVQPYNNRKKLVQYTLENDMIPVAYRVLYPPEINSLVPFKVRIMDDPLVQELARKYGKTPGQVLINWVLRRECAVIVKTQTVSRLVENWEAQNFELSDEDVQRLLGLPQLGSYLEPESLFGFPLFS